MLWDLPPLSLTLSLSVKQARHRPGRVRTWRRWRWWRWGRRRRRARRRRTGRRRVAYPLEHGARLCVCPSTRSGLDVRSSGVRSSFTSLVKRFEPQAKWIAPGKTKCLYIPLTLGPSKYTRNTIAALTQAIRLVPVRVPTAWARHRLQSGGCTERRWHDGPPAEGSPLASTRSPWRPTSSTAARRPRRAPPGPAP
jgi:hypothetical protein